MKTLAEITTTYNNLLAKTADLESQRLTLGKNKNFKFVGFVLLGLVPISILAYIYVPSFRNETMGAVLLFGNVTLFIGALIYGLMQGDKQFKPIQALVYERLVKPIIDFIHNELQFDANKNLPESELKNTGLLGRPDFRSECLISGKIGKTEMRVSQVEALTQIQGDRGASLRFKGLYGILKTSLDFGNGLYIRPKEDQKMQSVIGGTLAKLLTGKEYGDTVPTNNDAFDRNYQLSALDVTHAKKFVESALFQTIANLSNSTSGNPAFYLKGQDIHIALEGTNVNERMNAATSISDIPVLDLGKNLNFICGIAEAC